MIAWTPDAKAKAKADSRMLVKVQLQGKHCGADTLMHGGSLEVAATVDPNSEEGVALMAAVNTISFGGEYDAHLKALREALANKLKKEA